MASQFLCSYRPIISTGQGRLAIEMYDIPPFADGSCRREPDFESKYPSISALCRGSIFAPRLREGDSVIYIAIKSSYLGVDEKHWRLVAILDVIKRFESHENAANWYNIEKCPLPSNCIVEGNKPLPFGMTAGVKPTDKYGDPNNPERLIRKWDAGYKSRAKNNGVFLVCKASFVNLYNPPVITDGVFESIFGKIPLTRNPPYITKAQFKSLERLALKQK